MSENRKLPDNTEENRTEKRKGIKHLLFRLEKGVKLISELREYIQILHVITPATGIEPEEINYEHLKLPKAYMRKNIPIIINYKEAPQYLISALTDMLKNHVSVIAVYDNALKEGIVTSSFKRKHRRGDRIPIEDMPTWE